MLVLVLMLLLVIVTVACAVTPIAPLKNRSNVFRCVVGSLSVAFALAALVLFCQPRPLLPPVAAWNRCCRVAYC